MSDKIEVADGATTTFITRPVKAFYLDDFDEGDQSTALGIYNGASHVYVVTGDLDSFLQRLAVEVYAATGVWPKQPDVDLTDFIEARQSAWDAAKGDENDTEIQALQEALFEAEFIIQQHGIELPAVTDPEDEQ